MGNAECGVRSTEWGVGSGECVAVDACTELRGITRRVSEEKHEEITVPR